MRLASSRSKTFSHHHGNRGIIETGLYALTLTSGADQARPKAHHARTRLRMAGRWHDPKSARQTLDSSEKDLITARKGLVIGEHGYMVWCSRSSGSLRLILLFSKAEVADFTFACNAGVTLATSRAISKLSLRSTSSTGSR